MTADATPGPAPSPARDYAFSPHEAEIRDAVARLCAPFDDAYWLAKDRDGGFPEDFHRAFAEAGWLGICIPGEYGGSGLGVTEAAVMMQAVAASGALRRLGAAHEHLRAQPGGEVRHRGTEAPHA